MFMLRHISIEENMSEKMLGISKWGQWHQNRIVFRNLPWAWCSCPAPVMWWFTRWVCFELWLHVILVEVCGVMEALPNDNFGPYLMNVCCYSWYLMPDFAWEPLDAFCVQSNRNAMAKQDFVEFIQDVASKMMFRLLCIDSQSLYASVL